MQNLRHRNEVAEQRIKELEADNIKMADEREKLKNDPEYFEKIARERMGLIKEGEVIYKVLPPGVKKTEPDADDKPKKTVSAKSAFKTPAKSAVKKAVAAKTSKATSKKTADVNDKSGKKTKVVVNATAVKKQTTKN